jgi:hypothetical protein
MTLHRSVRDLITMRIRSSRTAAISLCVLLTASACVMVQASSPNHQSEKPAGLAPKTAGGCEGRFIGVLSVFGFQLGHNTLQDVQQQFGPAQIVREGDAGNAVARLCYRTADTSDDTVVLFESSEMGGGAVLTNYELRRSHQSLDARCVVSRAVHGEAKSSVAVRLGMTRMELAQVLGEPSSSHGNSWDYRCDIRKQMTEEQLVRMERRWPRVRDHPYFDLWITASAGFDSDRLVRFRVSKTETY